MEYAHSFVMHCFVVVITLILVDSQVPWARILQGCFIVNEEIVWLPLSQCQLFHYEGFGWNWMVLNRFKHDIWSVFCMFHGIYCICCCCRDLCYNSVRQTHRGRSSMPPITRFMGPTWGPSGADRTQVGPMLAPWTLLSGAAFYHTRDRHIARM